MLYYNIYPCYNMLLYMDVIFNAIICTKCNETYCKEQNYFVFTFSIIKYKNVYLYHNAIAYMYDFSKQLNF